MQLPKAKWIASGGGSKLYECDEFTLRWYTGNKSITLKGNKASEIKANFFSILESEAEVIGQSKDESKIASDFHNDSIKTSGPSSNHPTCDPTPSNLEQYLLISDLMSKFMQRIDDKVEGISNEVNNIRTNTIRSEQTDTINNLKREIDELKNENLELRQRNATITYVMADLQTKVKDIENEKNSLITAIKLIQLDQSNSNEGKS